ncbi:E3 ubiquitin-protein ligase Zswim2 [Lachnellula suecica]|uniref:Postreplication repair E3 ubiquitin-protein ligase RAD18 n=1 Tax=Lachnellula suecica TaxID=602035 RepID=A0A8T9C2F0_9HELO|nr:E3 ubiquitin-protein ligase Zswim2 [Lachnellula suecica]
MSDSDDENDQTDWASLTVSELKDELRTRGLTVSGKKSDLIDRLNAADGASSDSSQPEPVAAVEARQDFSGMTVPQLKSELTRRGLTISGRKADLLNRLGGGDVAPNPKKPKINPAPASQAAQYANAGSASAGGEIRMRDFVHEPDDGYKKKLKKVRSERLFMLDRNKGFQNGHVCENFDIAGSKGDVYEVTIGKSPKCTCMDARIRGQRCKHIKYALVIILKAPENLCYQDAFLSTELDSIFANAPVTRAPDLDHSHEHAENESMYAGNRKPIDGECPICVYEMEAGEDIVWCKAACGQNFHKECFEQWRRSKHGGRVTCVYCRTEWQEDGATPVRGFNAPAPPPGSLAHLKNAAPKIGSYKNVAKLMPQYSQAYHGHDE